MIMIFISIIMLILTTAGFGIAYQINGINKAVLFMPVAIFETSVEITSDSNIPLINKELLDEKLTYYFDLNIKKYSFDYDYETYFFNDDDSYCVNLGCSGVEIHVNAEIMYGYRYQRIMYYEVYKN